MKLSDQGIVQVLPDSGIPYGVEFLSENVSSHDAAMAAIHTLLDFYLPKERHVHVGAARLQGAMVFYPIHIIKVETISHE